MKKFSVFTAIRHRRWLILLALVTAFALITFSSVNIKTKTVPVSGIVTSFSTDPKTFNPALIQEPPYTSDYTHEGLVSENGRGEIEPALAESWKMSEDKKRIIFTLRKGLKWSDGKPLTADDVVFTYNDIFLNPAISNDAKDLWKIGKNRVFPTVQKIDNLQIEFIIPEPFVPFLRIAKLAILPAHVLREAVNIKDKQGQSKFISTWGTNTPPKEIIANGPYTIEAYTPGQRVIFRKNPYYWRKDAQGNVQPYIERVMWQFVDNTDTSLIQFRSRGLDYIKVFPQYFSLLKREEKRGQFTIYNGGSSTEVTYISFNLNKGSRNGKPLVNPIKSRWFNTVEFRQAVAYGVDRQRLLNNIYRGLGELANSYIPKQSPYYLSPKEGLKDYEYNPIKAKELLVKAGFQYNSQGQLLDSQGNLVQFTLMMSSSNKIIETIAVQIKQDLSKIGISVDLNTVSYSLFIDKILNSFDWECRLGTMNFSMEPNDVASLFLPEGSFHVYNQEPQKGQTPITGREVADWERKIGDLYLQAVKEFDEAKRKAIYAEVQRISQEYLPQIYLTQPLTMGAVRNHIQGIKYSALTTVFWNIYELKLSKQK
ncbi:ABC transporter substrate-binding protein [Brasilonema bromeliae]|uniref:ABC transporter substrate-binding protein n=1 Tax=Brasilonema bromeliae SPC951 TaxID=385972 RepID=A0ABX1PC10_9CYAN|nr:ABC transporter substrate-binding protein [Brasilonema bromeliae]NMG21106.1 ABC transporter substrate-binding protein [Brasilonema bromeliae SPC951]